MNPETRLFRIVARGTELTALQSLFQKSPAIDKILAVMVSLPVHASVAHLMGGKRYTAWIDQRAFALRRSPTPIEKPVLRYLKGKQIPFEFQKVIGHCIVDFFLPSHAIVIECDGAEFHKDKHREEIRDNYLEFCGFRTLHLPGWICHDEILFGGRIHDFMGISNGSLFPCTKEISD